MGLRVPRLPTDLLTDAVVRQNRGDLAAAQALYWDILLEDPTHFDALHLLGVSKCQQGQPAEGAWFIARALEKRPDDATARFNLAMAFADVHRHAEAVIWFDRALSLRPDHAPSWVGRADALQTEGRYTEAIESYQRALALRADIPAALTNMTTALLASGQAARALDLLRQALAKGAEDRGADCDRTRATGAWQHSVGLRQLRRRVRQRTRCRRTTLAPGGGNAARYRFERGSDHCLPIRVCRSS